MDRYRVAPARPVFLSSGATHHHVQPLPMPPPLCGPTPPAGRRSDGAELDIFTAERYFNAADATKYRAATVTAVTVDSPPAPHLAMDAAASQSGRTAASSEASWNSRSGLLASSDQSARQQQDKGGYGAGAANGGVVDTRDERYHRAGGKKPAGQRWGLFSRVDCPCVGRKAVTVGVSSEPPSPRTQHASSAAMDQEISAIFKAHRMLPPPCPSPIHEPEPSTMKIVSTTGSCAFPLRANNNSNNGILAPPAPNKGASFDAFPAPDIGRRVVVSSSGAAGFTFPVVIGPGTNVGIDEPPRESLEVFRPIDEDSVVLEDDLPPRPPSLSAAGFLRAPAPPATVDEDAMSDASSDLFDLESFAASSSYPTTCRGRGSSRRNSREEDDDLPPYASAAAAAAMAEPALSECMYAPSEASVVWSVATAEGFAPYDAAGSVANFSSAASACGVDDFVRFVQPAAGGGHDGFTAAMSRSAGRKKGGGFLNSCRCEKAVSVGPTPVRVARPRPPAPPKTAMALESGGAARYYHGRVHMPVRT